MNRRGFFGLVAAAIAMPLGAWTPERDDTARLQEMLDTGKRIPPGGPELWRGKGPLNPQLSVFLPTSRSADTSPQLSKPYALLRCGWRPSCLK